jgi:hypothetical protein
MDISWEGLKLTKSGRVVARLTMSEGVNAVTYNVYLQSDVRLIFQSVDRSCVDLAVDLLRRVGVSVEVKRLGKMWYVQVYTDKLATGHEELRKALAEIVREAIARGWVDVSKAERWLKKLERGRVLWDGWPKYEVRLTHNRSLEVSFGSTNLDSIVREVQRFREIGLEEGIHFTIKMPEGDSNGYVRILREGLVRAALLSIHGEDEQRRSAAEFVSYILQRAWEEGGAVYEKAREIVEEGRARGSLTLRGFERVVEVGGRRRVVKVVSWSVRLEESQRGKKLLRVKIAAEVDGVRCGLAVTFGRYGRKSEAAGYARSKPGAPGGREADAERLAAVIKALTGEEPRIYRKKNGAVVIACGRKHLEGFRRFAELADAVERWLNSCCRLQHL